MVPEEDTWSTNRESVSVSVILTLLVAVSPPHLNKSGVWQLIVDVTEIKLILGGVVVKSRQPTRRQKMLEDDRSA